MVTPDPAPPGLRLHLGCGSVAPSGWINVDASLGARLAKLPLLGRRIARLAGLRIDWSPDVWIHDLRRPFPWSDDSARAIYSSHTLEHLTRSDGQRFLVECARVLMPGGVLRLVVPDLAAILDAYGKGAFSAVELVERLGVAYEEPGDTALKRRLAPLFRHPHRCLYDAASLLAACRAAGFPDVCVHPPELSRIRDLDAVELPERARGSLIVEGSKPVRA